MIFCLQKLNVTADYFDVCEQYDPVDCDERMTKFVDNDRVKPLFSSLFLIVLSVINRLMEFASTPTILIKDRSTLLTRGF